MRRDYKTAAQSRKPGYLSRRMAMYRDQVKAEADRDARNKAEADAKVEHISTRKSA